MKCLGIRSTRTTSYHPQSNGMVERFHRTLKNALRCSLSHSESWVKILPWVLLGLRNAPKEDLGVSPSEMLYGQPLRVPGNCLSTDPSVISESEELRRARNISKNFVPKTMNDKKFTGKTFIPKALHNTPFVFVRDDTRKSSLQPVYTGPFQVLERNLEGGTFLLATKAGPDRVSIHRLKPAFGIRHD